MRPPPRAAILALLATSAGCSLIDLDSLQSGFASGGAASSSSSELASSGQTSTSTAASTSTASSTSQGSTSTSSTSTGGCMDAFCDGQTGLDACADFDSPAHALGTGWNAAISLSGGTTGTVTTSSADFASCPTSAVVDIVGVTGGRSWVQIAHDVPMSGKHEATFSARVKRSGPGGVPVDGAGLFEAGFDAGGGMYCQLYLQLYDGGTSGSYFFLQHWDGAQTVQLTSSNLDLPAGTANVWTDVKLVFDWSGGSKTATVIVNGVSKSISMPPPCNTTPPSVTGAWGVAYEDQSQTIRLDDLTASAQ